MVIGIITVIITVTKSKVGCSFTGGVIFGILTCQVLLVHGFMLFLIYIFLVFIKTAHYS